MIKCVQKINEKQCDQIISRKYLESKAKLGKQWFLNILVIYLIKMQTNFDERQNKTRKHMIDIMFLKKLIKFTASLTLLNTTYCQRRI